MAPTLIVASAHLSPTPFSTTRTLQTILEAIRTASSNGASLIAFPETFIPAFPFYSGVLAPAQTHHLFALMASSSIYVDGPEMASIRQTARECQISVSLGLSEKVRYSSATLFNSNIVIDGRTGEVACHHRKLVATWFEKLTWSHGDGAGLKTVDVPIAGSGAGGEDRAITDKGEENTAKIGVLICGENTNALARYTMIAQGEQVHISTWPCLWPTRMMLGSQSEQQLHVNGTAATMSSMRETEKEEDGEEERKKALREEETQNENETRYTGGGNDSTGAKNYDNVSANKVRAAAHCFEGKCFGIVCAGYLSPEAESILISTASSSSPRGGIGGGCTPPDMGSVIMDTLKYSSRAATMFLDPSGALLPGYIVLEDDDDDDEDDEDKTRNAMMGRGQMRKPKPKPKRTERRDMLQHEEGILYAEMDLEKCVEGKQYHDVVGGYQRLDVFDLRVDRRRREPVTFLDKGD